jgi:hypothetical protein
MKIKKWSSDDLIFLKVNYPIKGKLWCMNAMDRTESSIRYKASELKLTLDKNSDFFKEWQNRAANSKIGKKRPDQANVIKKLHLEGKLKKTELQNQAMSQRVKEWYLINPHPKGMKGKFHTEQTKLAIGENTKISFKNRTEEQKITRIFKMMKTKEKNGTTNPQRDGCTWKSGWREIGGIKKYYRSRWEANYARFLQWLKENGKIKDWKHEPQTFWFEGVKRGCVSYLPDFWVEELNESTSFHEVKGWMDDRSKTKLKRMKKYYPNISLVLIQRKEYKVIENNFSKIIIGWES